MIKQNIPLRFGVKLVSTDPNSSWIEILKDYFDRINLEDFKRLCWIVVFLWDFKRHFLKDFLQSRFLMQDFNGFII